MPIIDYLDKYIELGEFFSPAYHRDNAVLKACKWEFPKMSQEDAVSLRNILVHDDNWHNKFFVADLLCFYRPFDRSLLEPLLDCAIRFRDPSFNRIFYYPCRRTFGMPIVSQLLTDRFLQGTLVERISISSLLYWIRPRKQGQADQLFEAVRARAAVSDNLVELYFYALRFGKEIRPAIKIPDHAAELLDAIEGNVEYEQTVYEQLGWPRREC